MAYYEEAKEAALSIASAYGIKLDKAYKLGDGYVFDSSTEEWVGIIPIAVDGKTGKTKSLWHYLNEKDLTMDDMEEIEF